MYFIIKTTFCCVIVYTVGMASGVTSGLF